jgi:hypothetical protein
MTNIVVQGETVKVAVTDGTDNPPVIVVSTTLPVTTLAALRDVDASGLANNAVLVYDSGLQKWRVSAAGALLFVDGGSF